MSDRVLVIAPHPDDEAIGCGGSICLHRQRGDRGHAVFLTSGELSHKHLPREQVWQVREREAQAAAQVLGISRLSFLRFADWFAGESVERAAALLQRLLEEEPPQIIYLPHPHEWHPDHQATLPIVRKALSLTPFQPPALRGYEVWTPLARFDLLEDITRVMSDKLRAVRCYASQAEQFRYDRAVRGLNQFRGIIGGRCRYAEVYQCLQVTQPVSDSAV